MDDQNPFISKYGTGAATPAPETSTSKSSDVNPFEATYGDAAARSAKEQAYESKIETYRPSAEEQAKSQGAAGVNLPSSSVPFVGPLAANAMDHLAAALGVGEGGDYGPAKDYSERLQNIQARSEALKRAQQEQHPIASAAQEFGPSLVLPAGEVTKGLEVAVAPTTALGRAATDIAGLGLEGAGYGAASAAGEKYFGTEPNAADISVTQGALLGGALGAGLGVGARAAGAAGSLALEHAPEWATSFFQKDPQFAKGLAEVWEQDRQNGHVRNAGTPQEIKGMDLDQFQTQMANHLQNPAVHQMPQFGDIGGDVWQNHINDIVSKGSQDQIDAIQKMYQSRAGSSGNRFSDFLNKMYKVNENMNLAELEADASRRRNEINNDNYKISDAPNNGLGKWSKEWNGFLQNPDFQQAIRNADTELSQTVSGYKSPFSRVIREPGTGNLLPDLPIGSLRLSEGNKETLYQNKLFNVSDLEGKSDKDLFNMFYEHPQGEELEEADYLAAKRAADKRVTAIQNAMNKVPFKYAVDPTKVNTRILDQLQRELNILGENKITQSGGTQFGSGKGVKAMGEKIVNDLKDPKSPVFNKAFTNAHNGYVFKREQENAAKLASRLINSIGDTKKVHELVRVSSILSPEEKNFMQKAFMLNLLNKAKVGDRFNPSVVNKFFDNAQARKALTNIFGPQEIKHMETFARMEALQNDTNKIVGNMTGRTASAFTFSPLDFLIGTHSLWAEALKKVGQFSTDSAQRRLAGRILKQMKSNNIDDLQAAYRDLYQNQNMSNKVKMFVNDNLGKAIRQRATVAGATAMGRNTGGRVNYKDGGKVYGLGMGPAPLQSPKALLKPEKDVSKVGLISSKVNSTGKGLPKSGTVYWHKPIAAQDEIVQNTIRHRLNDFDINERSGHNSGGRIGYDEGGDVRGGDSVGGYGGDTGRFSGYNGGGNDNSDQGNDNPRADTVAQSQQATADAQAAANNRAYNQDVSPFAFGQDVNVSGNVGAAPSQGNPESVATPHLDYVNKVVDSFQGPESSYGQNTYNMSSGAFGPWGLMPNTAIDQLKQVHPEMLNRATGQFNPGDVAGGGLDTSQDPQAMGSSNLLRNIVLNQGLQRELVTNLTNQNMQTLASNGFATTPGNLYAAHMLGVNDAMKLLSADPSAGIESTGVNPNAIKSNRLNGLTVEDYLNHTSNVMAKAPAPPPAPTAGRTFQKKGGRVQRATGGRIPEVDKVFKEAKKNLDSHTKSMLNVHDDAIVNALRIAQGRI